MAERTSQIVFGIEGQFVVQINLTANTPVKMIQFSSFNLIEETSNLLPVFEISFIAGGDLEDEWNERKALPIIISQSIQSPEKIETKLQIIHPEVSDLGNGVKFYSATGVFYAPAFTQTPYLTSTSSCNGTDVLEKVASKYFTVDKRVSSQEQQPWFQTNTTDKKFLDYVMSHCYIKDSFVYCGITSDGTYIICDPVALSGESEKFTLTLTPTTNGTDIPILGYPKFDSKSGFMNSIGGYGIDTPIISLDSGVRTLHRPKFDFKFVNNEHSRTQNIQRRTNPPVKVSMSSDPKSTMGYANFTSGVAILSMESAYVTVLNSYFPIRIFDIVKLQVPEETNAGLNLNFSGKYMVTKVSRLIQKNMFTTNLLLCRDAHNKSN